LTFAYFADNPCHSCFSRKILQQTKACKELFALTHVTHNRLVEFARLIIESEVALMHTYGIIKIKGSLHHTIAKLEHYFTIAFSGAFLAFFSAISDSMISLVLLFLIYKNT
jgi:hypothetical protein